MPLYANPPKGDDFVRILPPAGLQGAICCDVVDQGMRDKTWDGVTTQVPKLSIHFLLEDIIPSRWTHPHLNEIVEVHADIVGLPFGISRWMTNSMHENANLRQFINQWRGVAITDAEAEHFDLDTLVGTPAALMIVHAQDKHNPRKYYANIDVVTSLPDNMTAPALPSGYVRIKDRPPRDGNEPHSVSDESPQPSPQPNTLYEGGPQEPETVFTGDSVAALKRVYDKGQEVALELASKNQLDMDDAEAIDIYFEAGAFTKLSVLVAKLERQAHG